MVVMQLIGLHERKAFSMSVSFARMWIHAYTDSATTCLQTQNKLTWLSRDVTTKVLVRQGLCAAILCLH